MVGTDGMGNQLIRGWHVKLVDGVAPSTWPIGALRRLAGSAIQGSTNIFPK